MVPECRVVTEADPMSPREPSSPKIEAQEPLVPSGEETLKKTLDEMAPPSEPSLHEQQRRGVEIQSVKPTLEKPTEPAEPTRVKPIAVEEEP